MEAILKRLANNSYHNHCRNSNISLQAVLAEQLWPDLLLSAKVIILVFSSSASFRLLRPLFASNQY